MKNRATFEPSYLTIPFILPGHIKQVLNRINIVGGVSGMSYRQDQGWKENLSRIAEKHPTSALAKEMGTRTTKQIQTEKIKKKVFQKSFSYQNEN